MVREKTPMPRLEALNQGSEVASTFEAAGYLAAQFKLKAEGNKLGKESEGMYQILVANSDAIRQQRTTVNQPWDGKIVADSASRNAQQNMTKDIVAALENTVEDMKIHLDCAIGDTAEFIRKFSSQDARELGEHSMQHLDNLLKAWFAENDIVIGKDGHLYEATDGKIKQDGKNNPIKADAEQARQLMNDEKKGFQQFMAKHNFQAPTVQQHKFPEQQPVAAASSTSSAPPK